MMKQQFYWFIFFKTGNSRSQHEFPVVPGKVHHAGEMATVLRVKVTDSSAYLSSGGRVQLRSFCSDLGKQLQSRCTLHDVIMLSSVI